MSAQSAISRFHRDLTLGALLRAGLIAAALLSLLVGPMLGSELQATIALLLVGGVWIALIYRSMKGSRIAADSPSLIAAGQFDVAERHILTALNSFSLFRNVKLLSLHHLAMLRHAQRRWPESIMLARALLRQRPGALKGLNRSARLLLADALLETGDRRGAYECMINLYSQRLSLAEALNLLGVQLDYMAQIGAYEAMLQEMKSKLELAELMPAESAAMAHALLALAARKSGWNQWEKWLVRRVELLGDVEELCARRPMLRELWA